MCGNPDADTHREMAATCACGNYNMLNFTCGAGHARPRRHPHVATPPCGRDSCSNGHWEVRNGSGYTYVPSACRLVRPTGAMVRQCLAGRHLLFFGDSLQRYLYLTLAHFLVHDEWPRDLSSYRDGSEASVCYESSWQRQNSTGDLDYGDGWTRYFEGSNGVLRGHEVCDCMRTSCCKESELRENRFTKVGDASVSFVTQLVSPEWKPHGSIPLGSHQEMRAAAGCGAPGATCNMGARKPWRMTAPEFMSRAVPRLGVTDVIINSGHHFTTLGKPQKQNLVKRTLAAAAGSASRGAWFRTTTPRMANNKLVWTNRIGERIRVKSWPGLPDSEDETDAAAAVGAGVMDMFEVMMRLKSEPFAEQDGAFIDGNHVQCSVNREMLILMLSMLCDFSSTAADNASDADADKVKPTTPSPTSPRKAAPRAADDKAKRTTPSPTQPTRGPTTPTQRAPLPRETSRLAWRPLFFSKRGEK